MKQRTKKELEDLGVRTYQCIDCEKKETIQHIYPSNGEFKCTKCWLEETEEEVRKHRRKK